MINGLRVDNFTCKCENCNSEKTSIMVGHVFRSGEFYGAKITVKCLDCGNEFSEIY